MRLALTVLLVSVAPAFAQESLSVEQLQRLKAATAFIKVQAGQDGATGSGFLIKVDGPRGYVVTNHHVIEDALMPLRTMNRPAVKLGSKIEAVFDSGTPTDRSLAATVLSVDPDKDLAVLLVQSVKPFPQPLDLQNVPKLRETLPIFMCGFPFGGSLSQSKHPEITINPGTVSAIRMTATGQVREVQLNGNLNSGNSGGPVVTADGKLIGVARATIRGSGIGLAIPQHEVATMLRGRTGQARITKGVAGIMLAVPVIDPLQKVQSVTAHVQLPSGKLPVTAADSPATLLPGGSDIALDMNTAQSLASKIIPNDVVDSEGNVRLQFAIKTTSDEYFTHPVDVSINGPVGSGGGGLAPGGGRITDLPPWLRDLFEDRLPLPESTESLPPTAAGTMNLSELNRAPANYMNQTIQVNAISVGGVAERPDGYELDAHSGSGRGPSNVRIILPKDLALQISDLGIEADEPHAFRLVGTVEKPTVLGEIRHTFKVNEIQILDKNTGNAFITFKPQRAEELREAKITLSRLNRFPNSYLGQTLTMTVVFRGVVSFKAMPEIELANGAGAKPLNLEFYTSRGLAAQAEDELRAGSQLARVHFRVERVNVRNGKGILGVTKVELINVRSGKVAQTLTANDAIQYPPDGPAPKPINNTNTAGKGANQPKNPNTPIQNSYPNPTPPPAAGTSNWILWTIVAVVLSLGLGAVILGIAAYILFFSKKKEPDGDEDEEPVKKSSPKSKRMNKPRRDDEEFPGFG